MWRELSKSVSWCLKPSQPQRIISGLVGGRVFTLSTRLQAFKAEKEGERDKERERERDRRTDRETEGEGKREREREKGRERDKERERERELSLIHI